MNDAETLKEVIELAIARGFEPLDVDTVVRDCFKLGGWHLYQIIYAQTFARAYFGEEDEIVWADDQRMETLPAHLYHLQQLVLLPTDSERINYYYENRGEK